MYYVYRLDFDGCCYIGCTSDISRRKNQHNENARKCSSKLGRYLNQKGIKVSITDFKVLQAYDSRPEALKTERDTAMMLSKQGVTLLNDNYSPDCSRKGKNEGNTAKEYVVIDYVDHTVKYVHDLRQFCKANGYSYKDLQRTIHRKTHRNRLIALHKEEWDVIEDKDFYVSGDFVKARTEEIAKKNVLKSAKRYEVAFPDGHSEIVYNLDKFAREHNLTSGTLHATLIKSKPTKGYQVIRRI